MGLVIYFYKIKSYNGSKDWSDVHKFMEDQNREKLKVAFDNVISSLKRAKDYDKAYFRLIKKLAKLFSFPHFDLKKLGVEYDYQTGKYSYEPVPLETFIEEKGNIINGAYKAEGAYFRKANFVYAYFQPKLVEERAWVEREDLIDLIDRCEKVLKDHSLAPVLLPTQSGFFFGSTEYDRWYFSDVRDCLKQMKRLLKGLQDDEQIFVSMSW